MLIIERKLILYIFIGSMDKYIYIFLKSSAKQFTIWCTGINILRICIYDKVECEQEIFFFPIFPLERNLFLTNLTLYRYANAPDGHCIKYLEM